MLRPAFFPPIVLFWLAFAFLATTASGQATPASRGQLLYVPVYSGITHGKQGRIADLSATLTIRNTDPAHAIEIRRVDHYDARGQRVAPYVVGPRRLDPLASMQFPVQEPTRSGLTSSSFLVEWTSNEAVSPPLVETIMVGVGAVASQGVSFLGQARVLRNTPP